MKWSRQTIGDLADIVTKGTTPTTLGFDFVESGIPFVRVQNLVGGRVAHKRDVLFIDRSTHEALSRSKIKNGDVLVSIAGTIGRAAMVDTNCEMNCNQAVAIVRFNESVDRGYVLHWFGASDAFRQMSSKGVTGTITNLSLAQLRSLRVPVPPLAEQKRIAEILDAADLLRAKRREAIAQLDSILQSVFFDMFGDSVDNGMGWATVAVGNEVSFLTSGSRGWARYYSEEGDTFIRIQNLKSGRLDLGDIAFVRPPECAEAKRTRVQTGDVLLSITADLGRTAVVPEGIGKAHINQHLAILRFVDMDPVFVSYQLASDGGQKQFARLSRGGVKAGLNFNDVKSIVLTKPPLDLQRRFATIVESVERQKARMRAHLAELDALFASLQSRAFNGEL